MNKRKGRIPPPRPQIPQLKSYLERGMYSYLLIKGFRSLQNLEIPDLGRINLFFGPNGTGKTTILEAVYAHACGHNFLPFQNQIVIARRGELSVTSAMDYGERLINVFNNMEETPYRFSIHARLRDENSMYNVGASFYPSALLADIYPSLYSQPSNMLPVNRKMDFEPPSDQFRVITDQGVVKNAKIRSVSLGRWESEVGTKTVKHDLRFPQEFANIDPFKFAIIHDILAHRDSNEEVKIFATLKRYNLLEEFIDEIHDVFPDIQTLDMVPYTDGSQGPIYAKVKNGRRIPLYAFGDGIRRWFYLLGKMIMYKNACHCIEEIEATFHPAAQKSIARLLVSYAMKFNNQLFLTSHSIEFADNFLEGLYGTNGILGSVDEDPVRVFTLKKDNPDSDPAIWVMTGKDAYHSREAYNLELR